MEKTSDTKHDGVEAPYPDWYLELKLARPWLVMHREDGPPPPPTKAPEVAMGEEEVYFIPWWAEEADDVASRDRPPRQSVR